MAKTIEMEAQISGIRAKVDGSLGIGINTPELNVSQKAMIMELQNMNVKLTIEPTDFKSEKVSIEKGMDGKSQSQRLYNVLFVYYKQVKSTEEFDVFYKRNMESIIDTIKSRLHD